MEPRVKARDPLDESSGAAEAPLSPPILIDQLRSPPVNHLATSASASDQRDDSSHPQEALAFSYDAGADDNDNADLGQGPGLLPAPSFDGGAVGSPIAELARTTNELNLQETSHPTLVSMWNISWDPPTAGLARGTKDESVQKPSDQLGALSNLAKQKTRGWKPQDKPPDRKPGRSYADKQLACPFYIRDPNTHRKCRSIKFRTTTDIRRHLLSASAHRQPRHCPICKCVFEDRDDAVLCTQLNQHIRQSLCTEETIVVPGVTEEQRQRLDYGENFQGSLRENWFHLWDILFPDDPRPISPFLAIETQVFDDDFDYFGSSGDEEDNGENNDNASIIDTISPDMAGFKKYILTLNPMLVTENNYLVERIAHQQVIRYQRLLRSKVTHLRLAANCPSGALCIAMGGSASILDPTTNLHELDHLSSVHDDNNSPSKRNINDDTFPTDIPMPPTIYLPAEFECQLCYQSKKFQKPSDWTKHVHEDIQPFTCTWDRCIEPKTFKRKADWTRHENERHRHLEWWFQEPKLKSKRTVNGSTGVDLTWQKVEQCHMETSTRPQDEPCRFCGKVLSTWKDLTVHLAKHMEAISLPVIRLVEAKAAELKADTIIDPVQDPPQIAPTDSGYASVKKTTCENGQKYVETSAQQDSQDTLESQFDDATTEYTNASSVGTLKRESYISGFADDLFQCINDLQPHKQEIERISTILPDLLKAFALCLGYKAPSAMHRDVMYFVHKHRRMIAKAFKDRCREEEENSSDTPDPSPTDGEKMPLNEIMNSWFQKQNLEEIPLHAGVDDIDSKSRESDEDSDDDSTAMGGYRDLVVDTDAFRWLLAHMEFHNQPLSLMGLCFQLGFKAQAILIWGACDMCLVGAQKLSSMLVGVAKTAEVLWLIFGVGSSQANHPVSGSGLLKTQEGGFLANLAVSPGRGIMGGAKFVLGLRDTPAHVARNGGYIPKLQWIATKFVLFWDENDKRGWLINGTSALLHIVRASLAHNSTDKFKAAFVFRPEDMKESPTPLTADSAIDVLINSENLALKLYHEMDGYLSLQSRIEHFYRILEKLIDHQADGSGEDGTRLADKPRQYLEGWDFKDLATSRDPMYPRVATLETEGKVWVDLTRALHTITLFGRGFGELIRPADADNCGE
ncbi:hypothetical protein G7Z17_g1345 [Cylindrodendrum hubeiense]|uniref:C2H2-type domain-containing protein n=1 Tax=Cylindrodendrum hubeiense TaxID=595255 RepID=A0A9P5LFH1_9HYPO|nr:hypothetical protein G7Z17_g1345 [Cylindrodendrum hubeiense]